MNEWGDARLLRRFVDEGDEAAFRLVVERHLRLVYAAAWRQLAGDGALAEEVAQTVFTLVATKARGLSGHPTLAGWLMTTTRNCAREARRARDRKRRNEKEAMMMQKIEAEEGERGLWRRIAPEIDELLEKLGKKDAEAVALRFFEGQSYADVGRALGVNENTARMRVERALEKLRVSLGRRGIASTAALLGAALTTQGAVMVPVQLAGQIAATAMGAAVASGSAAGMVAVGISIMKSTHVVSMVAALAVGVAVWQGFRAREAGRAMREGENGYAALRSELDAMRGELERTRERARAADEDVERLLGAIETSQANGRAAEMPKLSAGRASRAEVEERFQRARELAKSGQDDAKAMEEFLWCFDEGMVGGFSFMMLRGELIRAMGELATRHPPMRQAMMVRRERAEERFLGDGKDMDSTSDFATLSRQLDAPERIVESLSKLPAGDARRGMLMNYGGFDTLLEQRRYGDIVANRSFAEISQQFEVIRAAVPPHLSEAQRSDFRRNLAETTAKNIEALAGAGYSNEARELATKLLAYDDTPETRRVLAERLARAGRAELLAR